LSLRHSGLRAAMKKRGPAPKERKNLFLTKQKKSRKKKNQRRKEARAAREGSMAKEKKTRDGKSSDASKRINTKTVPLERVRPGVKKDVRKKKGADQVARREAGRRSLVVKRAHAQIGRVEFGCGRRLDGQGAQTQGETGKKKRKPNTGRRKMLGKRTAHRYVRRATRLTKKKKSIPTRTKTRVQTTGVRSLRGNEKEGTRKRPS